MINLNPETVCRVIQLAHEFHAKEEVVIPELPGSPTEDWALQVLADHAEDPTYQELTILLSDLEPDQRAQLLALMWLGRGDYERPDWLTAVRDAAQQWQHQSAAHLIASPQLADYLEEGLSLHGYSCSD
jgi:hypothetical protein